MGIKDKKTSGLDFEALNAKMNALDQKAEKEKDVQQEAVNLQELTEELKLVIGDVRHLVPKVRELSVAVERAGQQLEKAGKEGDMTYTLFRCAIVKANAEGIPITADRGSMEAVNAKFNAIRDNIISEFKKSLDETYNSYISKHKLYLDELERHERTMLLSFQCDLDNALSRNGCWCTPRVFWWFFGIFMFCFTVTFLVIVFLISGNLHF